MYKSESLIKEFCPTIHRMINKSKTDWGKIDEKFEKNYLKAGIEVESNLVGIMLKAKMGNNFLRTFLQHTDFLARHLIEFTKEKKKFREIIIGKFTNLESLNYLNPIGELSFLKKVLDNNFELIRIEDKEIFPKSSPKDFLLKSPSGSLNLIEIINIHLKNDYTSTKELKVKLLTELERKIEKETKGIGKNKPINNFFFQPVLWHVNLAKYKMHLDFFRDFKDTAGRSFGLRYNTLGFCTFGKTENSNLIFGEITSFYDKYEIK